MSTYTSLAFSYLVLGLVFLVCAIALAAYFVPKMMGRESGEGSRRGKYEMANKTHV